MLSPVCARVVVAVEKGHRTSSAIASFTGLSVGAVRDALATLKQKQIVRVAFFSTNPKIANYEIDNPINVLTKGGKEARRVYIRKAIPGDSPGHPDEAAAWMNND
jgi:hypothetical protein